MRKTNKGFCRSLLLSISIVVRIECLLLVLFLVTQMETNPNFMIQKILLLDSSESEDKQKEAIQLQINWLESKLIDVVCEIQSGLNTLQSYLARHKEAFSVVEQLISLIKQIQLLSLHLSELQTPDRWIESTGAFLSLL